MYNTGQWGALRISLAFIAGGKYKTVLSNLQTYEQIVDALVEDAGGQAEAIKPLILVSAAAVDRLTSAYLIDNDLIDIVLGG